jgi:hypothetical protein
LVLVSTPHTNVFEILAKATETDLDALHGLVTREMTARVRKGAECSTADLKAAAEWLVKNNCTGTIKPGTPLAGLLAGLTEGDTAYIEKLTQ